MSEQHADLEAGELRSAITEFLCAEAWEGRWRPLEETNIRPLAEQIAVLLAPWMAALIDGADDVR